MRLSGPILLDGFMGTGKSVVARRLGRLLGWRVVETDRLAARELGAPSVAQALAEQGEEPFREAEGRALERAWGPRRVIPLGGGASQTPALRRRLATGSTVVLTAPMEELERRVGPDGGGRPLWRQRRRLAAARLPGVGKEVPTAGLGPGAVAGRVLRTLFAGPLRPLADGGRVVVGWGALGHAVPEPSWLAVADRRLSSLAKELSPGAAAVSLVSGRDRAKSLVAVGRLLEALGAADIKRDGALVALGGGTTTDLAGVAAGLHLRGIALHLVPSTLLGMADAALGGKFAVNARGAKNQAGLYKRPDSVRLDTTLLAGLPRAEVRSGLGEVVKTSWLEPELRERMAPLLPAMAKGRLPALDQGVRLCARAKMKVVASDRLDTKGRRALLNYGHTLGHALESAARPRPRHGEAVALGMLAVARWAEQTSRAAKGTAQALEEDLALAGLPTSPERLAWAPEEVAAAAVSDKKRREGRCQVVYPAAPGELRVEWLAEPPVAAWLETLR